MRASELSGETLAYLGDGVYELMVRESLIEKTNTTSGKLHTAAQKYVGAKGQAKAMRLIEPLLTEEELRYAHLGRNAHLTASKKSDPASHTAASGLEALFGYLYAEGRRDRVSELFAVILESLN
ncbi:MAG TPA: ribonuclease III domain-containing protein [Candidatus Acidoferrum sp.]|nr:ribonuclease III domain-containing protein [Candidatus Acidoferrum sp.]